MTEVVVFPDAAAVVIDWLRPELAAHGSAVHVGAVVPSPRPTRFVTVRRHGGVAPNRVVDSATLTVECWAGSEEAAMDLAQLARGIVHAMQSGIHSSGQVYRVDEFGGPALLPDPDSNQPRVTFTVQVQTRGTAA